MKIKTSEATGLQLDWGLAKVMGAKRIIVNWRGVWVEDEGFKVGDDCRGWVCHTDPAVCMGLIKGLLIYGVSLSDFSSVDEGTVELCCEVNFKHFSGDTPEQAVARCVIAMKLGDEFECPDELGVV